MRNPSGAQPRIPEVWIPMTVGNPTAMIPIAILCDRMAIYNRLQMKTTNLIRTVTSGYLKLFLWSSKLTFRVLATQNRKMPIWILSVRNAVKWRSNVIGYAHFSFQLFRLRPLYFGTCFSATPFSAMPTRLNPLSFAMFSAMPTFFSNYFSAMPFFGYAQ